MIKKIALYILIFILIVISFFFVYKPPQQKTITFGVNFSQKHAQNLGLDWKETYSAIIDDLAVKNIKLAVHWDLVEQKDGEYDFNDLDWQINKAEENGVKLLLVIGMKTPRWPECHIPEWAKALDKEKQQEKILTLIEKLVLRYKDSGTIDMWQVENEPFFPFGDCPWMDKDFLKKEISLVKNLDTQKRPVLISDSGEGSLWVAAARLGDIVGTTMYKKVWMSEFKTYLTYPFPPSFYYIKSRIINLLFNKEVICVELQAEPWGPRLLYDITVEEQQKTMNLEQFKKNIEFAKTTGLKEFYLWGSEWWYWMKVKQNMPEIWNESKKLFCPCYQ